MTNDTGEARRCDVFVASAGSKRAIRSTGVQWRPRSASLRGGDDMSPHTVDRLIRTLAVVVALAGAYVLVIAGVPFILTLSHGERPPLSDSLAVNIFMLGTLLAIVGCVLAFSVFSLVAAWRIWRRRPTEANVRLMTTLIAIALWMIVSTTTMVIFENEGLLADNFGLKGTLDGIFAIAAMCFHASSSRWLIAHSSIVNPVPTPVSVSAISLVCLYLWFGIFGVVDDRVRAAYPLDGEYAELPLLLGLIASILAIYIIYRVLRHYLHDRVAHDRNASAPPIQAADHPVEGKMAAGRAQTATK